MTNIDVSSQDSSSIATPACQAQRSITIGFFEVEGSKHRLLNILLTSYAPPPRCLFKWDGSNRLELWKSSCRPAFPTLSSVMLITSTWHRIPPPGKMWPNSELPTAGRTVARLTQTPFIGLSCSGGLGFKKTGLAHVHGGGLAVAAAQGLKKAPAARRIRWGIPPDILIL